MRKYQLWLDSFKDVSDYIYKFLKLPEGLQDTLYAKRHYKICECLRFSVSERVQDRFTIAEIDSLLTGYKDEKSFLEAASKVSERYQRKTSHPLIATYQYRGELKQIDLVYDSPLLQKYALMVRAKHSSSRLEDSFELQQFCTQFLRMMEDSITRDYVLHPFSFTDISFDDAKKLNKYLPNTRNFQAEELQSFQKVYYNKLYQELALYAQSYDAKSEKIRMGLPTYQEEEILIQHQRGVSYALRKDYMTLRNAVLFMKTYDSLHQKYEMEEIQEEDSCHQLEFFSDSNHSLHITDSYIQKVFLEEEKDIAENEDILRQFALEEKKKWEEKYMGEEDEEFDSYGFEEVDHEVNPSFTKIKGMVDHG